MEIEIQKQIDNKLLERTEVHALVKHEGESVPTREAVIAKVAALLNKEKDQVVLIKMHSQYGMGQSDALLHVYNSVERALKVERPHYLKRSGIIKEEKEE